MKNNRHPPLLSIMDILKQSMPAPPPPRQPALPDAFWTCDPCKMVLANAAIPVQPDQLYCPLCRLPMQYHGPARKRGGAVDTQVVDITPKQIEPPREG